MPKTPDADVVQDDAVLNDASIDAVVPKAAKAERSYGNKVQVKITKFGHGFVSTGRHIAEHGDEIAPAGSILEVDQSVADALEAKGYAEIQ